MSWRDFWNQDTPIYVSERHKVLHYWRIANDIGRLVPSPDAWVLDYGCGEALSANRVASAALASTSATLRPWCASACSSGSGTSTASR